MSGRFRLTIIFTLFLLYTVQAQTNTDNRIRFYMGKISQDPQHYVAHAILGGAYMQKARETGDTTYYDRAEDALKRSLSIQSNYEAIRLMSALRLARHRFAEALAYAQKAVEISPGDRQAYAILFDVYFAMGYCTEAEKILKTMTEAAVDFTSLSRLSRLQYLKGDTQAAIGTMEQALHAALRDEPSAENIAWCQVQLGEYFFNLGNISQAEACGHAALRIFESYPLALEHLAKIRVAQKKYTAAIELYRKAAEKGADPELHAELGKVYAKIGRVVQAQEQFAIAEEKMTGALKKGGQEYYRHLALLYLSHDMRLDQALALSKKDMELRRDIYTYDTLAWAYYKNGLFQEAKQAIDEALKLGTQDALLFFHGGMIYYKLKDLHMAKRYLASSLSTNPHFDTRDAGLAKKILKQLSRR